MQQQLSANLIIPIPEDYILISRVELQELEQQQLTGVCWTMEDLEKRMKRKHEWIKEKVLYPSRFRKVLDVKKGGFVYYPESRGQKWSFQASKMAKFLDDHFHQIFSE
jgi:phage pi2 protein 07